MCSRIKFVEHLILEQTIFRTKFKNVPYRILRLPQLNHFVLADATKSAKLTYFEETSTYHGTYIPLSLNSPWILGCLQAWKLHKVYFCLLTFQNLVVWLRGLYAYEDCK
jgi:hypothetical protein